MKKSDLKSGMLVLVQDEWYESKGSKNGRWHLVIGDSIYDLTTEEYGFCHLLLDCYNENLIYKGKEDSWRITKVAEVDESLTFVLRDAIDDKNIEMSKGFRVIWERKELKSNSINVTINAVIDQESIDDIQKIIDELQNKLNNLKINLII